jgi:hypothetical protein
MYYNKKLLDELIKLAFLSHGLTVTQILRGLGDMSL